MRIISGQPNNLYLHEPQQNPGWGLWSCKTSLSIPLPTYYCPFQGASVARFILIVIVHVLSVRLWLFELCQEIMVLFVLRKLIQTHSSNVHTQPSSAARYLIFGRTLRLLPYFMCGNSEGSGKTVWVHRLAWAFTGRLCDKYLNLMSSVFKDSHMAICWERVDLLAFRLCCFTVKRFNWASSWDYGTYHIGNQWRLRRACASAQTCQSLCCSHTWGMEVDEGSDQKSDI